MPDESTQNAIANQTPRLAYLPLAGWVASLFLGGLFYYLDAYAPYREIGGYSKDHIESYCLWIAAMTATGAIAVGVYALVHIRRSAGQLRGKAQAMIGIVLNFVVLCVIVFSLGARALIRSSAV